MIAGKRNQRLFRPGMIRVVSPAPNPNFNPNRETTPSGGAGAASWHRILATRSALVIEGSSAKFGDDGAQTEHRYRSFP
jgi:hypothetical protein